MEVANKKLGNTALTDKPIPVQSKTSRNWILAMHLNEIQASLWKFRLYTSIYICPKCILSRYPTVSLLKLLEGPLALGGSLGEQTYKLPEGCLNIYPWTAFPSQLYSCNIINGFVFLLTTTVCFHCCLNEVPQIRVHTHQIHTSIQVPLTLITQEPRCDRAVCFLRGVTPLLPFIKG